MTRILATVLITMGLGTFPVAAASPKPNIVYILTHDLGYGDVQCLNPQRGKIPTPMVPETAGLKKSRRKDLQERSARLHELIGVIKEVVKEKKIGFIDLNTPLTGKSQFFTDGVHLNKDGCHAMADLVFKEVLRMLATPATENGGK